MQTSAFLKTMAIQSYYALRFLTNYRQARPPEAYLRAWADYKRTGIGVIKGFYSKDDCAILREEIDRIIEERRDDLATDPQGADIRIYRGEQISERFYDFYANKDLFGFAKATHLSPVINHFMMANRITAVDGNIGSGGGWHRDSAHFNEFKTILYLSDVGPENGPFQYVKHSSDWSRIYKGILQLGYPFRKTRFTEKEVDDFLAYFGLEASTLTGEAGDLIIANVKGLHRGKPVYEGTRYALTNYYWPQQMFSMQRADEVFGKNYVVPRSYQSEILKQRHGSYEPLVY